jgi:DNA polymerase-3 subunit epsilon
MRQVVLDTETTGLDVSNGHRIIEIGCVEMINRRRTQRTFHKYVQPDRDIDEGAEEVHGISRESLKNEPRFPEIAEEFVQFISGAELIIHNSAFDVGFLNHEFHLAGLTTTDVEDCCQVIDTLAMARRIHPGQRNSLDALCKRYSVDNSRRDLHGALLDAQLLAEVYLAMTGGQGALSLDQDMSGAKPKDRRIERVDGDVLNLKVVHATRQEIEAHERQLSLIDEASEDGVVWKKLDIHQEP